MEPKAITLLGISLAQIICWPFWVKALRYWGTITPFNVRYGDKVLAEKAGKVYMGWVGGFTNAKAKNISVYDGNWKRIGQFSPKKVQLIRRSNKLCVV